MLKPYTVPKKYAACANCTKPTEVRLKFCGHCGSLNEAFSAEAAAVSRGARAGGMIRKASPHFDVEAHLQKLAPEERCTRQKFMGDLLGEMRKRRRLHDEVASAAPAQTAQRAEPGPAVQAAPVHSAAADPSVAVVDRNDDDDEEFDLDSRVGNQTVDRNLDPSARPYSMRRRSSDLRPCSGHVHRLPGEGEATWNSLGSSLQSLLL